jgi:hypothetical protein
MVWKKQEAKRLVELPRYFWIYRCICVLDVREILNPTKKELSECPEGYRYKWAILAPGEPPKFMGERAAGIDNMPDARVRAAIQKRKSSSKHLAHRHYPEAPSHGPSGQWPVAGPGVQLFAAPQSPEEFWLECLDVLEEVLTMMNLTMLTEKELMNSAMTEKEIRSLEQSWSQGSAPTP